MEKNILADEVEVIEIGEKSKEMSMVKPLHDYVLIKTQPAETHSKGGILLPENRSVNRWRKGVVQAVGAKCHELQVDDKVAYVRFKGDDFKKPQDVDEESVMQLVKEEDISLVYDGGEKFDEVMG